MKKTIIAIVLILAAGGAAAYYFLAGPSTSPATPDNYAAIVPADTLFYTGASQPNEFADVLSGLQRENLESMRADMESYRKAAPRYGQAGLFLEGLLEVYSERAAQGKPVPGVSRTRQSVMYSVGIVPVLRVQLADAAAFAQFIDEAEQRGGAQSAKGSYQGVDYREYSIQVNNEPVPASLLVAVRPDFVVVTFDVPKLRDESLPLALGLKTPAQSLAQSGMIERIAEKHGFASSGLGFINHQAIVAALTGAPDSRAASMLTELDTNQKLASLREPGCRQDLQSIAEVWPITVMGVLPADGAGPDEVAVRERLVSRLTDPSLTATLSKLRGHIPSALLDGSQESMLGFALGLDVSSLAPVVSDLQQRFLQADFQCDWLIQAQQDVRQKNPAAATIAAAMISGVRGVSLSVFGFDPTPAAGMTRGIDALVNISATNPEMLFEMAKRMKPKLLGNVQIPSDGSSVVLVPGQGSSEVRAMIAGQHLLLFTGEQAAKVARNLGGNELKPNGLVYYRVDYGKLMPVLAKMMSRNKGATGEDADKLQAVQKSLRRMAQSKLRLRMSLDVGEPGIIVDMKAAAAEPSPGS
ncbi:MAG TPA: hypothetical protein VFK45_00040 [Gammaproteobacteria bacterium]|nr:hypothetical protein [Gammaproteobacteria bacterium]